MTKESIISVIKENENEIKDLGIKRLALFGSYSRNDESINSDIDLIWDLVRPRTLNSMAKAQAYLNSLFPNSKVDTVFEGAIHKYIKESIAGDIIEII